MTRWSGRAVTSARAHWRPIVNAGEAVCWRCHRRIVPDPSQRHEGWTVGHVIDRMDGGSHGVGNQSPEHSRCNYQAGGKRGAAITNARRPSVVARMSSERDRGIRGW